MLGWLWRGYDVAYRRFHGIEDLPIEGGSVVRIGVERYRGRRVVLGDGTVVLAGDLVGTIHFNNERVAAIHDRTTNPTRAGILMLRAFKRSLETLARLEESHPRYRAVKAFTATTILHQGTRRFGFEVFPPPLTLLSRIVAVYERSVLARFHPLGALRAQQERFAEVRVIWISQAELCRRYAPRRSSPSETSS